MSIKPPQKILVIALRQLGDVLLTTPLLHALRQAYPQAEIDVLVYENTAIILQGNPDISTIIHTTHRPKHAVYFALLKKLFRHYDLVVNTQTGDRPFIYSLIASANRIGVVPSVQDKGHWKRHCLKQWTMFDDDNTHTVLQLLKLVDLLAIPRHYGLVTPQTQQISNIAELSTNYVVLHLHPMWHYKRWTAKGWQAVAQHINKLGLQVVISGSPAQSELEYIEGIIAKFPDNHLNLAGKLSLGQLSQVISGAKLYIGPDTGITHLAAATGIAVIALFGPTNPVKWTPWPTNYQQDCNPFTKRGNQQVNNIYLIQGVADCVPCHQEGCEGHRQSNSACLDNLSPEIVTDTIDRILNSKTKTL